MAEMQGEENQEKVGFVKRNSLMSAGAAVSGLQLIIVIIIITLSHPSSHQA